MSKSKPNITPIKVVKAEPKSEPNTAPTPQRPTVDVTGIPGTGASVPKGGLKST